MHFNICITHLNSGIITSMLHSTGGQSLHFVRRAADLLNIANNNC